jgi:hypothetical protein
MDVPYFGRCGDQCCLQMGPNWDAYGDEPGKGTFEATTLLCGLAFMCNYVSAAC